MRTNSLRPKAAEKGPKIENGSFGSLHEYGSPQNPYLCEYQDFVSLSGDGMEIYTHEQGQAFKQLPEVYQVELCNACNLKCPMCLRTTDMVRKDQLLDPELVKKMYYRGDFAGSYYVELQMAGEPTLHPQLQWFIDFFKITVGVMVGLSTHGLLIKKKELDTSLLNLDALTISVDSLDPDTYHKMRYPAKVEDLIENLRYLFTYVEHRKAWGGKCPFIELQLIKTDLFPNSGDVKALSDLMKERGWDKYAHVRTTGDCFGEMQGRKAAGSKDRNTDLCVNPWTSVSVASNGDVVSCCFIFDPKRDEVNWLGNLNDQSLAEIWAGPRATELRRQHRTGELTGQCTKCYLKSPTLIHQNIVSRLVRLK